MSTKPIPLKKVVAYGVVAIVASSLLSLFFLFLQARSGIHRVSGEVVEIVGDTLTIIDAGGEETTLLFPDNFTLRGVDDISKIIVGQQIMSGGIFDSEGRLEIERLRVFGD